MKTLEELAQALQHHRKNRGLGQKDMRLKIGMSQQQYQRAESGNDLRVSTLLRILEGLDLELRLTPGHQPGSQPKDTPDSKPNKEPAWQGFLNDLED